MRNVFIKLILEYYNQHQVLINIYKCCFFIEKIFFERYNTGYRRYFAT